MLRASAVLRMIGAVVVVLIGLAAAARAEAPPPADPRATLATQLADETSTIAKTLDTIRTKLGEADGVRVQRLRAAYRVLRVPLRANASAADRMAAARRRAGTRMLVDRDARERALLVDEAARLRVAGERTVTATARLPSISLPSGLARPAKGPSVRAFGTLEHTPSKALLSRRGLDLEVEAKAPVIAPADGTVRYVGPIRGLDQGLIIEHGDYFTVIAKLGDVAVPVGAPVHRGDHLGRAARRRVYVEVRVRIGPGGIPIDPEPLFARE